MNEYQGIADKLSEEALLEQLTEELGELIQQTAKRLRILRGESYTPVSLQDNFESMTEEIADVTVCLNALNAKIDIDREHFEALKDRKIERWIARLEKNNE